MKRALLSTAVFAALIPFATGLSAANVTATQTFLCVQTDDVTDSLDPSDILSPPVNCGGTLTWSGLAVGSITIYWYLDGAYIGGGVLTGIQSSGAVSLYQGTGPSWIPTAGPHTLQMVVDPNGLIPESDESDNSVSRLFTVGNDSCSDARAISGSAYTNIVNTTFHGSSSEDPVPACVPGFGKGVWYKYLATADGQIVVDTIGSNFSNGLAIYGGSCNALTEIACNYSGLLIDARISYAVTAGSTYYILAGGRNGASGNLYFHAKYSAATEPTVTMHPVSQTVSAGGTATFTSMASGTPIPTVQWQVSTNRKTSFANVPGGTSTNLSFVALNSNNSNQYRAVFSNVAGSATSSVAALAVFTPVPLPDAVDALRLAWITGGDADWCGQSTGSHDGIDVARSGILIENQQSWLQTIVSGPGTLSFWWKVSSEYGSDKLRVLVDSVERGAISGEVDWEQRTMLLPSGSHTVQWRYSKDSSISRGADCGWVDGVMAPFTPPADGIIYVQGTFLGSNSDGTLIAPYKAVAAGYNAATNDNTIQIFGGNYSETVINMNKRLLLLATNGVVNIGVQ